MELVAGSYEQVLFGFAVHPEPKASGDRQQKWTPVADFTHHAHTASLSAVATNSRFVVTGSKDETIHIYDMKKKIDHGALVHHNGSITCLKFHGNRHLISGAEDGLICVWDAKKWECLKSIKAHKGHVTFLSIHPSGKLALSVGTDKTLRTWNLVEGRSAFIKNIKQNAHIVEWSPRGEKYIVVILNKIDVYHLDTASVSGTITNEKRVSSVTFLSESVLAVAGDEEVVRFFDTDSLMCLCEFKAHENRVKDMFSFEIPEHHIIVTASNDGFIKMWKLKQDKDVPPSLLCEVNTNARLTCLGVWLDSVTDTKESLPPTAELSPVSKQEQPKSNKKESSNGVQEAGRQSKPNMKKCGLAGVSKKRTKGSGLVSPKKRKIGEVLERKKRKKKI
ncbi:p21-activated protein kinase-interacting protein 1 isoform X1 [Molossus molossus]|uniref:p21-activated protein kinase-interacting protein 1 n=2 Tax=Molossus molossus TaxID=27622 RepID=A0A7J8FAX7_MOLMO|nr:p21-activated protein kinase-interacting protein 1 isoform X1 [Molossus molossus]XP_036112061.1 p21-activated protein kinase-interacting protein 1 isoform X1 [Molossus molossus]KAF6444721.1 PAK1 interacting protein 1 [Molossus molossus]